MRNLTKREILNKLFIYLFIYLLTYLSIYFFICLFICLCICLFKQCNGNIVLTHFGIDVNYFIFVEIGRITFLSGFACITL